MNHLIAEPLPTLYRNYMRYSAKASLAMVLILSVSMPAWPQTSATKAPLPKRPEFVTMATAIGDDYFDGRDTRARVRRHMSIAKKLGVHYLRCAFSWNGIEPERGKFQFAFWDMLVEEAAKAGIEMIPYVAYTPEWAARDKKEFWKQPPTDPRLFANLMTALATHFRGRIHSWEIWNEPDLTEYWQGTPDEFAILVKTGAEAVRTADSTAKIVLGGMSLGPGKFFQTLVDKHQVGRYVDVIAMHAYPESWHEDRAEKVFHQEIPEMEKLIESSIQRPLWLNEMGYADYRYEPNHASGWGTDVYYDYEHTQRYAADFLLKSFFMTAATGDVSLAGWYRIDDFHENDSRMPSDKVHDHLGIDDVNGRLKPAFYAFKFFNGVMSQPFHPLNSEARVRTKPQSQAVVHSFIRQDGKLVIASWLRSSEYNEVPSHTGMLKDSRSEEISLDLPCTSKSTETYNALGKRLSRDKTTTRILNRLRVTGSEVLTAVVTCQPNQ